MHLPNGAKVFFEKARGAAIPFTAMTNDAKNPKITVSDGKLKVKDIVIFTDCTWGDFVNKSSTPPTRTSTPAARPLVTLA